MLEPYRDRITWDAPIHSWADVEALPFEPQVPEREAVALRHARSGCSSSTSAARRRASRSTAAGSSSSASAAARSSSWRRSSRRRAERRGARRLQRARAVATASRRARSRRCRSGTASGAARILTVSRPRAAPSERAAKRRLVDPRERARPMSATPPRAPRPRRARACRRRRRGSAGRGGSARPTGSSARRRRAGPVAREAHVEPGLLARLAQRRAPARAVVRLDVAARLEPVAALAVVDEHVRAPAAVDDDRRGGEVRLRLIARARLGERRGLAAHRSRSAASSSSAGSCAASSAASSSRRAHSYCSASSTFSFAARRAGKIAATMPTTIVAIAKTISGADRQREDDEVDARDEQRAEHDPEHDPDHAADQRGDHALVADHPPHLPARHPDRAQHPELARALEHGEHERVHDPEQADDRPTARAGRRGCSGSSSARRSGCR